VLQGQYEGTCDEKNTPPRNWNRILASTYVQQENKHYEVGLLTKVFRTYGKVDIHPFALLQHTRKMLRYTKLDTAACFNDLTGDNDPVTVFVDETLAKVNCGIPRAWCVVCTPIWMIRC
jgi:hypothetical protein